MVQDPDRSSRKFQEVSRFFTHANGRGEQAPSASHCRRAGRSPVEHDGKNDSSGWAATGPIMIGDILDTYSTEVARANALARALVTARMDEDLSDYIELLDGLKRELRSADSDDPTYVLGIVGSLALIAAMMVRTAERSGLHTEDGRPLLAGLFDLLVAEKCHL